MISATADTVRQATVSALQIADQEAITSIAFPALGTGVGRFSIEECAWIMVRTISDFLSCNEESVASRIVFVLRDEAARCAFQGVIDQQT